MGGKVRNPIVFTNKKKRKLQNINLSLYVSQLFFDRLILPKFGVEQHLFKHLLTDLNYDGNLKCL